MIVKTRSSISSKFGFFKTICLLSFSFLFTIETAQAENLDYYLVNGVNYDQSVLKPDAFFGYGLGDQPLRHDRLVTYLQQVAGASERMTVETIGYSHEGRPILFLTISSPENLARIETIRQEHLATVAGKVPSEQQPVVTWINYGVHGAEASGMDSVVPTVYHLAAAQDDKTKAILSDSVIVITAVFNPDGHARRASWVTSYGSKMLATNPIHDIHSTIWPGARTNHYWFDLNRQWLLQTQPESRAWLSKWHQWKPNVSADMHEMGANSTYYFHPGVPTRKYPLIPDEGRALLDEISSYHTRYFDQEQKLYFAEEGFDNFYIGKGSTYPQINGGLGILFEAGAQMGIARESDQGLKTYSNNIRNHMRTSLTTLDGAAGMRRKLLQYQHKFFENARDLAAADDVKGYIFASPEDPVRQAKFIDILNRHSINFHEVMVNTSVDDTVYPAGSYYVSLKQRQYRMIKASFNRITEFPDKVFYDVSGWTLPLAYGMMYDEVKSNKLDKELTEKPDGSPNPPSIVPDPSASVPDKAPYAYVFRNSDYYAPRAINRLLSKGVLVRVGLSPLTLPTTRGNIKLDRGVLIVPFENQPLDDDALYDIMKKIAKEDKITVHAAISGRSLEPGSDLGGRGSVRDLKAPKPLMIIGPGVSSYDAGEVWHQLDYRMNINLTMVRRDRMAAIDWHKFTHLIMVGGRSPFRQDSLENLKNWVRAGGTVIASRQNAAWAAENLLDLTPEKPAIAENERLSYDQKTQRDAKDIIGGAIFENDLDLTHPLAFGYRRNRVASHRNTTIKLPLPLDPYARVGVYTDSPLLAGYASAEKVENLKNSPSILANRYGQGSVILFVDNPNFRATYLGMEKLFLNALFFSTAFDQSFADDAEAQAVEE